MTLTELFTNIANAIRGKDGTTGSIPAEDFPERIEAIDTAVTPTISVSSGGLITAMAGDKSATKQLTTQSGKTVTPSTSSQTAVASGRYTTGTITVAGDSNLKAENIKKGISIFGVDGSAETGGEWTYVFFSTYSGHMSDDLVASITNKLGSNYAYDREIRVTLTKAFSEVKLIYVVGMSEDYGMRTFVIHPSIDDITGDNYEYLYYYEPDDMWVQGLDAVINKYDTLFTIDIPANEPIESNVLYGYVAVKFH